MIALVRIAPVEKWCEAPRNSGYSRLFKTAGLEVEIETTTMKHDPYEGRYCDGRYWTLTPKSAAMLDEFLGKQSLCPSTICEHMLELD